MEELPPTASAWFDDLDSGAAPPSPPPLTHAVGQRGRSCLGGGPREKRQLAALRVGGQRHAVGQRGRRCLGGVRTGSRKWCGGAKLPDVRVAFAPSCAIRLARWSSTRALSNSVATRHCGPSVSHGRTQCSRAVGPGAAANCTCIGTCLVSWCLCLSSH